MTVVTGGKRTGLKGAVALALSTFIAGAFCPSRLLAQISPDEQARRLLEDGRAALREGKLKQALDNLNTIVSGFANTEVVDDALLEVGRAYLEIERDVNKARSAFDEVARRYPQGDAAPGAYYHLGWLALGDAATRAQLEEALAQFTRLCRLYPKSEWVPRALHAAGLTQRKLGRFAEAIQLERRVFFEYPRADVAPAAQFEVGHSLALMGKHIQALEEFQRLRNYYPESELAVRALDRSTALWRLYGGKTPSFTLDPEYSLVAGNLTKGVRDILMAGNGALWIASEKANVFAAFEGGRNTRSLTAMKPRSLSLSANGELVAAAESAVRIGPKDLRTFTLPTDQQIAKPLDRIATALVLATGECLVADIGHKAVFRFDPKGALLGRFAGDTERRVIRLLFDGEGAIVMLDREQRCIESFDPSGQRLRRIELRGEGFDLRRALDMASDPQRNLYVVDEQAGVCIFNPEGRLLTVVGADSLSQPQAIALEPDGAILVYDAKQERIVRFH